MSTALEPKHSDSQSTDQPRGASSPPGAILALGFGTTVAMWAVAYFCRLPGVMAPGPLLAALFVACLVAGGFLSGKGGALAAEADGITVDDVVEKIIEITPAKEGELDRDPKVAGVFKS